MTEEEIRNLRTEIGKLEEAAVAETDPLKRRELIKQAETLKAHRNREIGRMQGCTPREVA